MADENTQVGNPDSSGESQSSGTGQQSVDLAALQKSVEQLQAQYRGLQKGTDKINARSERQANAVSNASIERILELAKSNKTPAEIARELLLDDLLTTRQDPAPVTQTTRQGERDEGTDEDSIINRTVTELKLDPNDATVAKAIAEKNFGAIINLAVSKSTIPEPDSSTAPPLVSKESTSAKLTAQQIEKGYMDELARIPRGKTHQVSLLKAKWRETARKNGLVLNV